MHSDDMIDGKANAKKGTLQAAQEGLRKIKSLMLRSEKSKERSLHFAIFIAFMALFGILFHGGFLLYGDFASTFFPKNQLFLSSLQYTWSNASFLGYEVLMYNTVRVPFCLLADTINATFGYNAWWLFFGIMYFFRYYLFFKLLRYYEVETSTAAFVSLIFSLKSG